MGSERGDCCNAIFIAMNGFQIDKIVCGDDTTCMEHIDVIFHAVVLDCVVKYAAKLIALIIQTSLDCSLVRIYLEVVFGGLYIHQLVVLCDILISIHIYCIWLPHDVVLVVIALLLRFY